MSLRIKIEVDDYRESFPLDRITQVYTKLAWLTGQFFFLTSLKLYFKEMDAIDN